MNKSVFLMTADEEARFIRLVTKVDAAINEARRNGENIEDAPTLQRLFRANGIDIAREAGRLAEKSKLPAFSLEPTKNGDLSLFLYTDLLPTMPALIPHAVGIYEDFQALERMNRTQQADALAAIRDTLSKNPAYKLPQNVRFLDFAYWGAFYGYLYPVLTNLAHTKTEEKQKDGQTGAPTTSLMAKMPTAPATHLLSRVLNAAPNYPAPSKRNRHEKIKCSFDEDKNISTYTRTNRGETLEISVVDPSHTLMGGGILLERFYTYIMVCWAEAGYGREFSIPLHELVNNNMYGSIDAARLALKTFMQRQAAISIWKKLKPSQRKENGADKEAQQAEAQSGEKPAMSGGILFYNVVFSGNNAIISVNEKFPTKLVAQYYTYIPRWAFGLSNNGFKLMKYIAYLCRQNVGTDGKFSISMEAIRADMGLPDPRDVPNSAHKARIKDPIENAIEEIEEAMRDHFDEMGDFTFTITPQPAKGRGIFAWLQSSIEIVFNPAGVQKFIEISGKHQQHIKKKQAAKEKAKAEQEAKKQSEKE